MDPPELGILLRLTCSSSSVGFGDESDASESDGDVLGLGGGNRRKQHAPVQKEGGSTSEDDLAMLMSGQAVGKGEAARVRSEANAA